MCQICLFSNHRFILGCDVSWSESELVKVLKHSLLMVCYVKPLLVWKVTPQGVLMLGRQPLPILHLLSPSALNKLIQLQSASTPQPEGERSREGEVTPFSPAPRTENGAPLHSDRPGATRLSSSMEESAGVQWSIDKKSQVDIQKVFSRLHWLPCSTYTNVRIHPVTLCSLL